MAPDIILSVQGSLNSAMLVMALTAFFYLIFLVIQQFREIPGKADGYFGDQLNCPVANILYSGPQCAPRQQLVTIPQPSDIDVLEMIPKQVELMRCGGVCHTENSRKKCVPEKGSTSSKRIPVSSGTCY